MLKECRICFQNDDKEFLSPCLCSGTSKYVHKECLEIWRTISINKEGYYKCMECKTNYKTIKIYELENYKIIFSKKNFIKYYFSFIGGVGILSLIITYKFKINIFHNKKLIKKLNKTPLNFCFNFSLLSFFLLFFSSLIFFRKCYLNIKRKEIYYKIICGELIFFFISNMHFILLYLIIGFAAEDEENFIRVELITSLFSLFSHFFMYKRHNSVIEIMNKKYNYDMVINYN